MHCDWQWTLTKKSQVKLTEYFVVTSKQESVMLKFIRGVRPLLINGSKLCIASKHRHHDWSISILDLGKRYLKNEINGRWSPKAYRVDDSQSKWGYSYSHDFRHWHCTEIVIDEVSTSKCLHQPTSTFNYGTSPPTNHSPPLYRRTEYIYLAHQPGTSPPTIRYKPMRWRPHSFRDRPSIHSIKHAV